MSLPGCLKIIAEVAGEENALAIGKRLAGQEVKFPSQSTLKRKHKHRAIRKAASEGATTAQIAQRFGVSQRRVQQILQKI